MIGQVCLRDDLCAIRTVPNNVIRSGRSCRYCPTDDGPHPTFCDRVYRWSGTTRCARPFMTLVAGNQIQETVSWLPEFTDIWTAESWPYVTVVFTCSHASGMASNECPLGVHRWRGDGHLARASTLAGR